MTRVPNTSAFRVALAAALLVALFSRTADAATVTVPGDYPTIQAAINAVISGSVPDGSTIEVQAGTYGESLSVNSTSRSFTVRATGGVVIVDAAGKGTAALTVTFATGEVVFEGLTFRNGTRSAGGGFLVQNSSPSFIDCIFENNTAYDGAGGALFTSNATFTGCVIRNNSADHFGGGVYIVAGSRPVFTNCDIVTNASGTGGNGGGGNNGAGGGVFSNDSSPTFRWSSINGNSSKFASGGIHHQGIFGSPHGRSLLVVEDTEVADNVSTQFPGEPNPSEGGGIHVEDDATATLTRVRILRNSAGTGGGLNAYRGQFDITDSIIDANQATVGFGGGIAASSNFATPQMPGSVVNLTTSLVRNNTALLGGGIAAVGDNFSNEKATVSLISSVVSGNQSQTQGGGILANQTVLTTTNSLIINNSVISGSNPYGGGILVTTLSAATINTTTISHNTAGQHGGGVFVNDNSSINMTGSNIYDNTAGTRGAGIFVGAGSSGIVQGNVFADNTGTAQINEDGCTTVTYPNNLVTPAAFSGCGTLASRAPGTDSTSDPRFATFLAVPSTGTSMTLAWSVARATSVTVSGIGTWNSPNNSPTGSVDVSPGASTIYSLTATATGANGGNYTAVTASVTLVQPPPPPGEDLALDLGPGVGLWTTLQSGAWEFVHSLSPEAMVAGDLDDNGLDDLVLDFGPGLGLYAWMNGETWAFIHSMSPSSMVVGDFDNSGAHDLVFDFPGYGLWRFDNNETWSQLHGLSAAQMAVGDLDGTGGDELLVSFAAGGLWTYGDTSGWAILNGLDVTQLVTADLDNNGADDVIVAFAGIGLWSYMNQNAWAQLHPSSPAHVAAGDLDGDAQEELVIDFGLSTGVWILRNNATWSMLHSSPSEDIVMWDADGNGIDEIAIDFGPSIGLWTWVNDASWQSLHPQSPQTMTSGHFR